ncbi:hypothetical protein MmiAt1_08290 [Methanimicrococcus sp. At1]|uniref:Uncharacterized protein n=1 Tax=Methanimicrococcus hacksteinii TaxID=3028293 RepID=A0ABU3VPD8_9EURY|nr:hypothetical protein [Methanimicrococcus sp. At1]
MTGGDEWAADTALTFDSGVSDELVLNLYTTKTGNSVTINYYVNGVETAYQTDSTQSYGSDYTAIALPVESGYSFSAWSLTGGDEWAADTALTFDSGVSDELVLNLYTTKTGNSVTINYYVNGVETAYQTASQSYGSDYTAIALPVEFGYSFSAWSLEGGGAWAADTALTTDSGVSEFVLNLYTTKTSLSVIINYYDEELYSGPYTTSYGGTVLESEKPEDPESAPDQIFQGWFTQCGPENGNDWGTKWIFGDDDSATKISESYVFEDAANGGALTMNLYACWEDSVAFDANGGKFGENELIRYIAVTTVKESGEPDFGNELGRKGYYLAGWSEDQYADADNLFDFTDEESITGELILYAVWEEAPQYVNVIFHANGGTFTEIEDVTPGIIEQEGETYSIFVLRDEKIPSLSEVTLEKDDLELVCWVTAENIRWEFDDYTPEFIPDDEILNLYAVWSNDEVVFVTFNADGNMQGEFIILSVQEKTNSYTIKIEAGTPVSAPDEYPPSGPVGYVSPRNSELKGWFLEGSEEAWDFSNEVFENMVLIAEWISTSTGSDGPGFGSARVVEYGGSGFNADLPEDSGSMEGYDIDEIPILPDEPADPAPKAYSSWWLLLLLLFLLLVCYGYYRYRKNKKN